MNDAKEEIDLVFEGFGLLGSIYISNFQAANNPITLAKLGIKAVITTARGLLLPHSKDQLPNYLYLPIDDNHQQSLSQYFSTVFDFMEKNRARTNVLVHCFLGISRSAAFIIAYLIRKYGYSVTQSLLLLKRKRSKIKPNPSFIKQLEKYQQQQQTQRIVNKTSTNVANQAQCTKKIQLVSELNKIKACSSHLQAKISQVKEKILDSEHRKRSNSEYLKQRLLEKSISNSRNTSRAGSEYGETPNKGILYMEMPKGTVSAKRTSFS